MEDKTKFQTKVDNNHFKGNDSPFNYVSLQFENDKDVNQIGMIHLYRNKETKETIIKKEFYFKFGSLDAKDKQDITGKPDEINDIQIVKGKDYCTLLTCTPNGINSHRLLVRGSPSQPKRILHARRCPSEHRCRDTRPLKAQLQHDVEIRLKHQRIEGLVHILGDRQGRQALSCRLQE